MDAYPWYEIITSRDSLLQGQIINSCPIITPTKQLKQGEDVQGDVTNYDVVVMSQSCDLEENKINLVLVCPFFPLIEFEKRSEFFKSKKGKEQLRQGNIPGYHLLNKCDFDGFFKEFQVVDFHNVYAIDIDHLKGLIKKQNPRIGLLPPYREHLSQAFARFFMRVGLPQNIPKF